MLLKIALQLTDIRSLTVEDLLGQYPDPVILVCIFMEVSEPVDHSGCIPADHDLSDFGVRTAALQLTADDKVYQEAKYRIKMFQIPSSLQGDAQSLCLRGVIFQKMLFQRRSQTGIHGVIQNAADLYLTGLGRL